MVGLCHWQAAQWARTPHALGKGTLLGLALRPLTSSGGTRAPRGLGLLCVHVPAGWECAGGSRARHQVCQRALATATVNLLAASFRSPLCTAALCRECNASRSPKGAAKNVRETERAAVQDAHARPELKLGARLLLAPTIPHSGLRIGAQAHTPGACIPAPSPSTLTDCRWVTAAPHSRCRSPPPPARMRATSQQ